MEEPQPILDDAAPPAPLPDDYYVTAFLSVLDVVEGSCGPILTAAERDWAASIHDLPVNARRLYIRLMMRRGNCFRLERLRYAEIDDLAGARRSLIAAGLASGAAPTTLAALLRAYTLPELERLLSAPAGCGSRRAERVAALLSRDAAEDRTILASTSQWLSPLGHDLFAVYRLCFFGNLHQDLSEFVLRDLGTVRYESYPLERAGSLFRTRHQLDCHLRYYECELLFDLCPRQDRAALAEVCARLPPHVGGDAHLERRLDRLRCAVARRFERLGEPERALELYRGSVRPPARERAIRLLDAQGRAGEASAIAAAMRASPLDDAEADHAERRLSTTRPRAFRPMTTSLTLVPDGQRVERAARAYYARTGACFWTENRLVTGVLGLWMWDVVFAPVPGAFFNPFQSAPADFRERSFRRARQDLIATRMAELDGEGAQQRLRDRVMHTCTDRFGIANPLVGWGALSEPLLELALGRIPVPHWRALFERLLDDPGEHGSGLPDLIRFPDDGGYELIEIKGPGDALQQHQRRWLRHFDAHRIPARVVNVRWAGFSSAPSDRFVS